MKPFISWVFLFTVVAMVSSCATQNKIVYLQDQVVDSPFAASADGQIKLQAGDEISISVSSKNQELAAIFNKQRAQQGSTSSSSQSILSYTLDGDGCIDFPILGELELAGMTKQQVEKELKSKIISSDMLNDAIVTVEFKNLGFSAVGEISSPGRYLIEKEQINIFEALSVAGDLTIYGLRDRVFLTRRVDDKLITYNIDLRSADIYNSPAYYIQQNDVIYVEPSKIRANQSTINGNTVRSTSFWMSLASFVTTIVVLILN